MSEHKAEITLFRMGGLPSLAIYLGIGALLHAMIVGPQFDWSSAWTWGWLLGWPIALFIAFWGFILAAAGVGLLITLVVIGVDQFKSYRSRKRLTAGLRNRRERAEKLK